MSTAHAEAEAALQSLVSILEHDFDVVLVSMEIRQWLQAKTAGEFGIPLPIREMTMTSRKGELTVGATLGDVPEALEAKAQQRVNALLRRSQYGAMMQAIGPALLRSAAQQFLDRRDFDIIRTTPQALDLELSDLHERFFFGKHTHTIRMRVDRKKGVTSLIRFYLQNDEFMSLAIDHKPLAVPGHGEVLMPSRSVTQHNLTETELPKRYSVNYIDYRFVEPKEATSSP